MKIPSGILVFLLILQIFICFAPCSPVFGQYRFDTWTTDNGLPQNGVRAITQTPDGYLWFTTFDGLVRFDGVRFNSFGKGNTKGIINNRFTGLFSDRDGTLYATTMEDGILTVYRNGVFSTYTSRQVPGHYIQKIEPDAHGEIRFLVEDDDRTTKSWYYLRDDQFVFAEKDDRRFDRIDFQAKSGARWTFTPDEAVEVRRDGAETRYPLAMKKVNFRLNLFEDSAGNVWIGGNSVHRLGGGMVRNFGEREGLPQSIYHSFWEEADGSVWFASGGASSPSVGLLQYKDERLHVWGMENGLPDTSIFSVFRDREGTTWLATNKGLSRLQKKVVSSFGKKDGIRHSEVYPLFRDRRDNIWIGTTKGVSLYRDGKFTPLELTTADERGRPDETWRNEKMSVQSFWEDARGRMLIGLNGGIFIAENEQARMLEKSGGHHVFAIREDRRGNVWAATNKGVLHYRDDRYVRTLTVRDGLPNEFMTLVFEDSKGEIWFGGFGGLSLYRDGEFVNYTTREGLTGSYVRSMYEDADGALWIGTYDEGLSRFKDGKFVSIKAENGLYNNGVFAIEEDARGNFWISSNRGIYRVSRRQLNDFADRKLEKVSSVGYGREDGMLSNECNGGRQPSSVRDKDGRFWFPTQEGVAVVDPQAETSNALAPPVVIESATVEKEPADIRGGLTIEPGQKNIEINFTGISLIKSKQIRFKYKLEGHDADWIDADTRRTAYYSYLPPGNYRFLVIAANSDGVWNETGASLDLALKPFFYQTDEFYLLCALGAVLAIFLVWKVSVYQLEARERRLARLVGEKTEELRKVNEELQLLAHSDGLTTVGNRRLFEDFLADEWHRAIRFKTEISLILLDIDHFKLYNDTYGHHAGDECLKKVAAALRETIHRPTDLLARFGGEEFAIVLGGTDLPGALTIARQAMENVKNLAVPHRASKTGEHLTISVGVATTFVTLGMTEAELIKAADEALYEAKAEGRNRIAARDLTAGVSEKSILEEEFLSAR